MRLAQTAQHGAAVELWQDDVEKDGVGLLVRNAPQRLLTVARLNDCVPAVEEFRLELNAHEA